jgi:NAD(P)-dependent dehydrogenase (short-subunit alcohol dehydrogenase family)
VTLSKAFDLSFFRGVANNFSYSVSKHAVLGAMRALQQDLFGSSVHTCCVCPGFTDTKMLRNKISGASLNSDGTPEFILPIVSAGRLLLPEEVARAVAFCASNSSVNGSVFHINLGQKQLWYDILWFALDCQMLLIVMSLMMI